MNFDFVTRDRLSELMEYIDQNWRKGHVLSVSKELLLWQHNGTQGREIDFLISSDSLGKISGILGFINPESFSGVDEQFIWYAMWHVREDHQSSGLGLALQMHLNLKTTPKCTAILGINKRALSIYKALRFKTGTLDHWYLLNSTLSNFKIAFVETNNAKSYIPTENRLSKINLENLESIVSQIDVDQIVPTKNFEYLLNRYIKHPFYKYDIYLYDSPTQGFKNLLVTRNITDSHGHSALRIIDVVGHPKNLNAIGFCLQNLIQTQGHEYVDLIASFEEDNLLECEGFSKVNFDCQKAIIPNYFEPFEQKNVPVNFAVKNISGKLYFPYKGDGDQDRPNLIE